MSRRLARLAPAILLAAAVLHVATAVRSRGLGRDRFVAASDVIRRWRSGESVWLITEESRLELWRARLGGDLPPIFARSGTRVLLGNRPARAG